MNKIQKGLIAAVPACALMLLAHFTLHPTDPPPIHAYTFILTWAFIGVVTATSSFGGSAFWRSVLWSMLVFWVVASWGTYWEKDVYLSLGIPQLICGVIMGGTLTWLERRP